MENKKLCTGSIMNICSDDTNINEYIFQQINCGYREDKDDSFFVCNLGDVVKKWQRFQKVLPIVQPFYGKNNFMYVTHQHTGKHSLLHLVLLQGSCYSSQYTRLF